MMLANFFSKSKPVNFVVIFLLFTVYFLGISTEYDLQTWSLTYFFELLGLLLFYVVIFFLFNQLVITNELGRDSSFSFLLLVLFLGSFSSGFTNYQSLLAIVLLFVFFRNIFALSSGVAIFEKLFDAGFWLGAAFLIAPSVLVYLLFIYFGVLLFYKITIRTLLIPILGFAVPVFIFFTFLFLTDAHQDFDLFYRFITKTASFWYDEELAQLSLWVLLPLGTLALVWRTPNILSVSGQHRKHWLLVVGQFLISALMLFFLMSQGADYLILLLWPLAIVLGDWIASFQKVWLKEAILLLLFLYSVLGHFIV